MYCVPHLDYVLTLFDKTLTRIWTFASPWTPVTRRFYRTSA